LEPLEIADRIKNKFPREVKDIVEFRGQVSMVMKRDQLLEICIWLHDDPEFHFDYLKDLCGVDYLGRKAIRFEVVYTLYSLKHDHMIRLRAEVSEEDQSIESVVQVWIGADWHERECHDLFGIIFKGHPDLKRILLPDDWEGHPLRKDYPVQGPEEEWPGFQEVLDTAGKLREFIWKE
jgi:NADH-quinone oxidoreductase subunit C